MAAPNNSDIELPYEPEKFNAPNRRGILRTAFAALLASISQPATGSQDCFPTLLGQTNVSVIALRPPRPMPPVRLFRLEGGTLDLATLRGKPLLINFWASWCPPCRRELPILDRLLRSRRIPDLRILAVSHDKSSRAVVEGYKTATGLRELPIFHDPHEFVAYSNRDNSNKAPFALYGMPITYLVSRSGLVVAYASGNIDWDSDPALRLLTCLGEI
jgi:thiol-disulfide isomerase/thioredoxin